MPDLVNHPQQRETDKSRMAQVNYWFALRGFVMWSVTVVISILGFIGMQFTGPGARVTRTEAEIVEIRVTIDRLVAVSEANARLNCFNPAYTQQQRELVGLDCSAVLRGDYVRTPR